MQMKITFRCKNKSKFFNNKIKVKFQVNKNSYKIKRINNNNCRVL